MELWTLSVIFLGLKKCWRLQTGKEKKNSIKVKGKHFGCIMRYDNIFIGKNPLTLLNVYSEGFPDFSPIFKLAVRLSDERSF